MNTSPVEPYLRRDYRKRRVDWKTISLMFAGAVLFYITGFVCLMVWGASHAEAHESYSAVIKDGEILTPQTFYDSL